MKAQVDMGMLTKMIQPMIKATLRDPKKRAYIEATLLQTADTFLMQKYMIAKLTGKWAQNGEIIDLDEPGDIDVIKDKLEKLEKDMEEIKTLLKKLTGEE